MLLADAAYVKVSLAACPARLKWAILGTDLHCGVSLSFMVHIIQQRKEI